MEPKLILHDSMYFDEENEKNLKNEKEQLGEKFAIKAKQDGDLKQPKTQSEFAILALNGIETEVQRLIDCNEARYLPVSGEAVAKVIQKETDQKIKELQKEQHGIERQMPQAEKAVEVNKPDLKLIAWRKWVFVGLVLIAGTEGCTSYSAFRHGGLAIVNSVIASIAIALAVGFSSHFAAGWLKAAIGTRQKMIRYVVIFAPAILVFGLLAILRSYALTDVVDLHVGTAPVAGAHSISTAIAFGVISMALYIIAIAVSVYFFRTETMRLQEQRYEESCQILKDLQEKIQQIKNEILKVEKDKIEQMTLAIRRYDYAKQVEGSLINFAQQLSENYKSHNIHNRTDGIPEFYKDKSEFTFNTFFND